MGETIIEIIESVGFPIAVSIYLLYRLEIRLINLEKAIVQMGTDIKEGVEIADEQKKDQ